MGMEIGPGALVRLRYELRDGRGNVLENPEEPVEFVWGYGALVPGLEVALEGFQKGEIVNVSLDPEDAYGTRDESNVFLVAREEFPEDAVLEEGAEFVAEDDDGTQLTMRVLEVHEDRVLVDANHPLAGETLNFQVRVLDVRPATDDELLVARVEHGDVPALDSEPA